MTFNRFSQSTSRRAVLALVLLASLLMGSCKYVRYIKQLDPTMAGTKPVDHVPYDALLKKHVDAQGMVNYRAFLADSTALGTYLTTVSNNLPNEQWNKDDQLAYWINAYNAFTIQRVLRGYPVKSIRQLGGDKTLVNTVWDQQFIRLGNDKDKYSLNDLEQRLIRRKFSGEYRIHFALVCAAISCPKLRNEAYTGSRLQEQLDDQARDFINNPNKNKLTPANAPQVSSIFDFYPGDFKKDDNTLSKTINKYSAGPKVDAEIQPTFMTYNWDLNEQK
ncbi:DUF547 domain-containing protein [Hymenobacter glacialis]|uniref:DUF547 domain-containing protein n=1 Tax=Hymenobacter glacialis TaxID=1908236 RepID=A0A1G1T6M3_9BACT|nr:DUF547 domain-containing protein [Hymenobacter glacialis]OGX86518.1 hypothetical protein BEN48_12880 [Hymenobacter glacialis]